MRVMRTVGIGVVAAIVGGGAMGVVARVLMRAVTLSADAEREFTLAGSFFIVMIYAVAMVPGAIAAAFTLKWWRWLFAAAGSVFLFFPAVGVASEDIGSTEGLSAWRWVALIVTSVAVFATIALVPIVTVRLVDRLRAPRSRSEVLRHQREPSEQPNVKSEGRLEVRP